MAKQKRYSLEFREMAVRRMKLGDNVSQLSRELGVDRTCLYQWKRKHDRRPYSRVALPEPDWRDKRIEELEAKIPRLEGIIGGRLSPAHAGYQPWYGQSKYNPSAWLHYLHEANPWDPNVNTSVQAAQNAFKETFGVAWDEFDLMQLLQQRECVTTTVLGNTTTSCN